MRGTSTTTEPTGQLARPSLITRTQLVMVPIADADRAVAFYEMLGFEKRVDIPWGDGYRWIEVYPQRGTAGLALVPPGPGEPIGVRIGVILNTGDIDRTHAELGARGVDVDAAVARVGSPTVIRLGPVARAGPVPPMFWLRDPDGNALLVVLAN